MNKYVVGFLSLFDNNLELKVIEAESDFLAAITFLEGLDGYDSSFISVGNLEELKLDVFNGDCLINVIQIDSTPFLGEHYNQ